MVGMVSGSICTLTIFCLVCLGCTRVPPADDCRVASVVNDKIGKQVRWNQGCYEDGQVDCVIQNLLQHELVIDSAIQIALLNNPEIQAVFEEIGIAQADLVQAGLFQNPFFDGYIRFPDHHSLQLNTAFSVSQNFLDIFLIPLRKKIAVVGLEQAYLRVVNAVLDLSFDVQEAFYNLQAEQTRQNLLASIVSLAETATQLALAQRQEGNINDLDLQNRMNEYLESKVEFTQSQIELIHMREKMNKLLGFPSSDFCWRVASELPELPEEEIATDSLEAIALSQRLDLDIARWEVQRMVKMLGVKRWWAYTDSALGISTEHEAEGFQETGAAFSASIPLFNYGQADRLRIYSMYRQSQERQKALEIKVLSEVRAARDQLFINRNFVLTYQRELLPLQEQIVLVSQKFYNTMTLSVYKLLDAKRRELQMQISYKLRLRNYWISRIALDRSLGGGFYLYTERYVDKNLS